MPGHRGQHEDDDDGHPAGRDGARGGQPQQHRRQLVAALLARPVGQPAPQRGDQQRGADEADEEHGRGPRPVQHLPRQVVDGGEHAADAQRLQHVGGQQDAEVVHPERQPEVPAQPAGRGGDRVPGRPAGAGPRAQRAEGDEQPDDQGHHPVAGAAAHRVAEHRGAGPAGQDGDGEHGDPPGQQHGALVRVVGDLRRQRDEGDLEHRVRHGAEDEGHHHPGDGDGLRPDRAGEEQDEADGQAEPADQQERAASPGAGQPVADPAGDGVEQDVERLRQEDDDPGQQGGDAEGVGQVGEQQQARGRCRRTRWPPRRWRSRRGAVCSAWSARRHPGSRGRAASRTRRISPRSLSLSKGLSPVP